MSPIAIAAIIFGLVWFYQAVKYVAGPKEFKPKNDYKLIEKGRFEREKNKKEGK